MIAIHWFRRDLRIEDNTAFINALNGDLPVLPVFIFDDNILSELAADDARVTFIYDQLAWINKKLHELDSGIYVLKGKPEEAWKLLLDQFDVGAVYYNEDYEPYATERDQKIRDLLSQRNIRVSSFRDQVIFNQNEVLKDDGQPYTVFTPYKRKWLEHFRKTGIKLLSQTNLNNLYKHHKPYPSMDKLGFKKSGIQVRAWDLSNLEVYPEKRDIPSANATSHLSPHLRFGTVSIRQVINESGSDNEVFLSELIWREFFMQILAHYPRVVNENFKSKYNGIRWRNDEQEFERWKAGNTGYPIVDAGMRQLNTSGTMHNRVRMVVASFLCKHLLIDWRWGEAYFAKKLLDYELSSNNGNWQWAAGTGCDAAPYFRVFNPYEQQKKFDPDFRYIKQWIPEFGTSDYPEPMVDHKHARDRAIESYKKGIATAGK